MVRLLLYIMSSERTIHSKMPSEKNNVDIGCYIFLKKTYFLSAERKMFHREETNVSPRRDKLRIAEEWNGVCEELAKS